jgi:hypothetical protein
MQNKKERIKSNSLKNNINYILAYPLLFVILGIFLLPKLAFLSSITNKNIIDLTNKERINLGIPALNNNELLNKAAMAKGESIIKSQTFQHDIGDKKFSSWIKEVDYKYAYVGENLAIDFTSSEGAIKAWLNSPSHKKNLLNNKFKEIGVAVVEGNFQGKNTIIVVQIFGTTMASLDTKVIAEDVKTDNITAKTDEEAIKNLNPVKYQPNLIQSSLDLVYDKKISTIIILNFVSIFFISLVFTAHKIIGSQKKSTK